MKSNAPKNKNLPALLQRIRVDRRCPRCNFHGYHDGNYMGRKNIISCCNCSHEWRGRITKDEQS